MYLQCRYMEKGFPCSLAAKNLPAMQETQEMLVQSLGLEDPLQKEMATHSSVLAWEISWREEPGGSPWDCKESGIIYRLNKTVS